MAISDYLQKLVELKNQLVDNLVSKGVEATQDEKLNTLVPKVLEIGQNTGAYTIEFLNGNTVFNGVRSVTSIKIPNGVTSIGTNAFYQCNNLISITIPKSVTTISSKAFVDCQSLTDVYFTGTVIDWHNITIESFNTPLIEATMHYNYTE